MFPLQFGTHTLKLKKQKINTAFLVKKTRTNLPHFVFLSVIVPCAAHSNTPTRASRNIPLTHARTYRSDMEGNCATIFIFSHICKNKVRFWETLTHSFSLPFEMTHRNNLFDNFRESSRSQFMRPWTYIYIYIYTIIYIYIYIYTIIPLWQSTFVIMV